MIAETKNNSAKTLSIVGVDTHPNFHYKGLNIEYVGRVLIEGRDNYGWEVTNVLSNNDTIYYEVILYRDRVNTSEKDRWDIGSYRIRIIVGIPLRESWGWDTIHTNELGDKSNLIDKIYKLSIGNG